MSRFAAFLLVAALPLSAQTRSVIVEFKHDGVTATAHRDFHERLRSDVRPDGIRHEYSRVFFGAAIRADANEIARIRALPYVASVHEDHTLHALAFDEHDVREAPRAAAIDLPTRGRGITIAIIDTGVDYHHPLIRAGYAGGYDFVNRDDDPLDDSGHGTHIAGIAATVAPEATIVAYKVLDANGTGSESDFLAALERAVADHVQVLNASLGFLEGTADHVLSRAVDNAVAAGIVAVVSAGNSGNSGVGTITTPATSRRAITVGALDAGGNDVAFFSSRGPTPGLLTFKPDIAAPGVNVVSAKLGGGTAAASGTSVSSPYVAGAAALLLSLHPDWTPDRVKSALVRSAAPAGGDAFARGGGKVDIVAAASATLEVSETGLSFGGNGALEGTRTESRRFTVANRGTQRQTLTLSAQSTPNGCAITINPPSLDLATGQSAEVTVQLASDAASMRPPSVAVVSGDIVAAGTSSFVVPWALVRGARATTRYEGLVENAVAFGDRFRNGVRIDDANFEFWVPSNVAQDYLILTGEEPPRLMTTEHRATDNDLVSFKASDATLTLDLQGHDRDGVRLADLPRVAGRSEQWVRLRMIGTGVNAFFNAVLTGASKILATPIPSRLKLETAEIYADVDAMRGYVVQHRPMTGLVASVALTNDPYVHARLLWPLGELTACYVFGDFARNALSPEGCVSRDAGAAPFDLYTTPEVSSERYVALLFARDGFETPPFRAFNGTIVATEEPTPAAAAYRIANEGEARVGAGPSFPLRFFGTGPVPNGPPPRGFTGPLGEILTNATATSYFTMRDANGAIVAKGALDTPSVSEPEIRPGYRLQVIASGLSVAGHNSRGQLDVQFADEADQIIAPTITSLQLLSSGGTPTDTLQRGEAATLRFAAADYVTQGSDIRARGVLAPHVSWRVAGTTDWHGLPLTETAIELTTRDTLKHLPSGSILSVDMRDATAIDNVAIDLRFEFEDVFGNKVAWTQEPAFVVGSPAKQTRRRSSS